MFTHRHAAGAAVAALLLVPNPSSEACVMSRAQCQIISTPGGGQALRCLQIATTPVAVEVFAESREADGSGADDIIVIEPADVVAWPPLPEVEVTLDGTVATYTANHYRSFGSSSGESCACGFSLPSAHVESFDALALVDADSGEVLAELPFAANRATGAGFDDHFTTGAWTGFSADTLGDVEEGRDVLLRFTATVAPGTTLDDLLADLAGDGVALGTDAADPVTGEPSGAHLSIVPVRVAD